MRAAEYPEKKCREPIFGGSGIGYACELPAMHMGPCATFSAADSVQRRDQWEAEHPEQARETSLDGGDIIIDQKGRTLS